MSKVNYEIIKPVGVLSGEDEEWTVELNLISWNGGAAKYDIRKWAPGHEKMGKGIALNKAEAEILVTLLKAEL